MSDPQPQTKARSATEIEVPRMDCPSEEQAIRLALSSSPAVEELRFDLAARRLIVVHAGACGPIVERVAALGLGARLVGTRPTTPAERARGPGDAAPEQRALRAALGINAAMFGVELLAGLLFQSTGLVADSLDMFADAAVYGLSLLAVGRAAASQRRAAHAAGWVQMALAAGALLEVLRRLVLGSAPQPGGMIAVALLALAANLATLRLLAGHREGGAHMRASWIFTTNDVLANLGVVAAGGLVAATGSAAPDLVIGTLIALVVAAGAVRILRL